MIHFKTCKIYIYTTRMTRFYDWSNKYELFEHKCNILLFNYYHLISKIYKWRSCICQSNLTNSLWNVVWQLFYSTFCLYPFRLDFWKCLSHQGTSFYSRIILLMCYWKYSISHFICYWILTIMLYDLLSYQQLHNIWNVFYRYCFGMIAKNEMF